MFVNRKILKLDHLFQFSDLFRLKHAVFAYLEAAQFQTSETYSHKLNGLVTNCLYHSSYHSVSALIDSYSYDAPVSGLPHNGSLCLTAETVLQFYTFFKQLDGVV